MFLKANRTAESEGCVLHHSKKHSNNVSIFYLQFNSLFFLVLLFMVFTIGIFFNEMKNDSYFINFSEDNYAIKLLEKENPAFSEFLKNNNYNLYDSEINLKAKHFIVRYINKNKLFHKYLEVGKVENTEEALELALYQAALKRESLYKKHNNSYFIELMSDKKITNEEFYILENMIPEKDKLFQRNL